jgi:NADPH2:quinone reductase
VLRPRGIVAVYGTGPQATIPASFCLVNNVTLKFMLVYELTAQEREAVLADVTRMLEGNRLIHNIAKTFPLSDIVAAHHLVEQGQAIGNVIVDVA